MAYLGASQQLPQPSYVRSYSALYSPSSLFQPAGRLSCTGRSCWFAGESTIQTPVFQTWKPVQSGAAREHKPGLWLSQRSSTNHQTEPSLTIHLTSYDSATRACDLQIIPSRNLFFVWTQPRTHHRPTPYPMAGPPKRGESPKAGERAAVVQNAGLCR